MRVGWLCLLLGALALVTVDVRAAVPTVHIVPHSHWDVGWLDTVNGYFSTHVRVIINNVLDEMDEAPARRFILSEVVFLRMYWDSAPRPQRVRLAAAIARGQIEIVGGGLTMPDEALSTADELLRQWTLGHAWLNATFAGLRVRAGWQIDPFGASSAVAQMLEAMGIENLVINRLDLRVKAQMRAEQGLEFRWRPPVSAPTAAAAQALEAAQANSSMLVSVLYDHYSTLYGYDWEAETRDGRGPYIYAGNIAQRAADLVATLLARAGSYRSGHILLPYGNDFSFKKRKCCFRDLDLVLGYIQTNLSSTITVRYSTLSEYFAAVRSATPLATFPTRSEADFFPYRDQLFEYWSGYFASRPGLKRLVRLVSTRYRVLAGTLAGTAVGRGKGALERALTGETKAALADAQLALGVLTHHDAITGTANGYVVSDYTSMLVKALNALERALSRLDLAEHGSADSKFAMRVFNPLPWARDAAVSLAVPAAWGSTFVVETVRTGERVAAQLDPAVHTTHTAAPAGTQWMDGQPTAGDGAPLPHGTAVRHLSLLVRLAPMAALALRIRNASAAALAHDPALESLVSAAVPARLETPSLTVELDSDTGAARAVSTQAGGLRAEPIALGLFRYGHTSGGAYLLYDDFGWRSWLAAAIGFALGALGVDCWRRRQTSRAPAQFSLERRLCSGACPRVRALVWGAMAGVLLALLAARQFEPLLASQHALALPLSFQAGVVVGMWARVLGPRSFAFAFAIVFAAVTCWTLVLDGGAHATLHAPVDEAADAARRVSGAVSDQVDVRGPRSARLTLRTFPHASGALGRAVQVRAHVCLAQPGEVVLRLQTVAIDGSTPWRLVTDNALREIPRATPRFASVASRYYPVVSVAALVRANAGDFAVISEHALGATASGDGTLELMVHRRLLTDDERGLTDPLDDRSCHTSSLWLYKQTGSGAQAAVERASLAAEHEAAAVAVLHLADVAVGGAPDAEAAEADGPPRALEPPGAWPRSLQLLTFDLFGERAVLVRVRSLSGDPLDEPALAPLLGQLGGGNHLDWQRCNLDASSCGPGWSASGALLNRLIATFVARL